MNPLHRDAVELTMHGCTVIPIHADGTKRPALARWQDRHPATASELEAWFGGDQPRHTALGVVCGPASGNLEMLEIEGAHVDRLAEVQAAAEGADGLDLLARLDGWCEASPSGGVHWFYRVADQPVPGNTKLAATAARETVAETRGTGGQTVLAPTGGHAHASGQPWRRLSGGPATVPTLTAAERDQVHAWFRALDQTPARPAAAPRPTPTPWQDHAAPSPLDAWEKVTSWADILEPHGWTRAGTRGDETLWTRPGKNPAEGVSATTGYGEDRDRLYVFSTSTEFDPETPYTKPGAYAVLNHGGDHSAAAAELRRRGFGGPRPRPTTTDTDTRMPTATTTATDTATATAGNVEHHRGQMRMAYRLAAAHGHRLMYVKGLGWHHWDGRRWAPDETAAAEKAVHTVLRAALDESYGGDKELRADVQRCETAAGIRGVLDIAATLDGIRVPVDALDADPHLLNVANGTLDLRTRQLNPHNPADRITKLTAGAYRPHDAPGDWAPFLATVLPDKDVRDYLQRVIGQAVYGGVREHLFPVLTGTGANGKGTAYTAAVHALGDYAAVIDPGLLVHRGHGAGGPELMQLFGARLVIGSETEEGAPLDAPTMKRLTGGDPITARHLYQEPVTWTPSHQLLWVTNHLPKVKGNDPAVWRRVRVIPFNVVIPEPDRDPTLSERLTLAADAVLTWAVAGWFDYLDRGGMEPPAAVTTATDDYAVESDAVRRFVRDVCITGAGESARSAELHRAWTRWGTAEGADPLTQKAFSKELDRLGYRAKRTKVGAVRQGIGLGPDLEG